MYAFTVVVSKNGVGSTAVSTVTLALSSGMSVPFITTATPGAEPCNIYSSTPLTSYQAFSASYLSSYLFNDS